MNIQSQSRPQRYANIAVVLLSIVAIVVFLLVAIPRFLYPYEVQWMEGSMLDHISRIFSGHSLYSQPSINFVPWLYTPCYYYAATLVCSLTGLSFVAARIPSLIATLGVIILLAWVVRKETRSSIFTIAAVGLYLASYVKTELIMLSARVDPLFTFFVLASAVTLYYSRNARNVIFGAGLFVLCLFTKQTGIALLPFFAFGLYRKSGWRQCFQFTIVCIVATLIILLLLNYFSNGWFSYYALQIPRAGKGQTLDWWFAIQGFVVYIVLRSWPIAIGLLALVGAQKIFLRSQHQVSRPVEFFGIFFLGTTVVGFGGILNQGGGHNVFLPLAAATAVFLPLMMNDKLVTHWLPRFGQWLLPIQLLLLISYPWSAKENVVSNEDAYNQEMFFHYVQSLQGEVWVPFHGFTWQMTGRKMYADYNAIRDVLLVGDRNARNLESELDSALVHHQWQYILSDVQDTFPHYILRDSVKNLNRIRMRLIRDNQKREASPWIYIYVPSS
ncbi:MAG TPA: hypothetical protein VEW28_06570 [Candidatus Kapabacteria bacterium]|nr:hypothetical protein [Candidatus Kapabacteria bacterium]